MSKPRKKQPLRSAKQSLAVLANAFKQIGGRGLFAAYGGIPFGVLRIVLHP